MPANSSDSLIKPLPEPSPLTAGSETQFQDLVASELGDADFAPGDFEATQQQMVDDWPGAYGTITSLDKEQGEIEDAAAHVDPAGLDAQYDAYNAQAGALDTAVDGFTDFNTAPAPPPLEQTVTDDDVQQIIEAGNSLTNLPTEAGTVTVPDTTGPEPPAPSPAPPEPPSGNIYIQPDKSVLWNTQNALNARVYVSVDGSAFQVFAEGREGQQAAPWISDGHAYTFRLVDYSAGADGVELRRAVLDVSPGSTNTGPQNSLPATQPTPPAAVPTAPAGTAAPPPSPPAPPQVTATPTAPPVQLPPQPTVATVHVGQRTAGGKWIVVQVPPDNLGLLQVDGTFMPVGTLVRDSQTGATVSATGAAQREHIANAGGSVAASGAVTNTRPPLVMPGVTFNPSLHWVGVTLANGAPGVMQLENGQAYDAFGAPAQNVPFAPQTGVTGNRIPSAAELVPLGS